MIRQTGSYNWGAFPQGQILQYFLLVKAYFVLALRWQNTYSLMPLNLSTFYLQFEIENTCLILLFILHPKVEHFGHVHRMTNDKMVKILYEWKPISTSLPERPKIRWEKNIRKVLRIMKINHLTKCIPDQVKWEEVIGKTKTFKQWSRSTR